MKKIFCTFADSRLSKSSKRIKNQILQFDLYDDIKIYSELDFDREYYSKYKYLLNKNVRGFGYWMWKPYFIQKTLNESCEYGDVLHYADSGCWMNFNEKSKQKLIEYINEAKNSRSGINVFSMKEKVESHLINKLYPENAWTKGDIFNYFDISLDSNYATSEQIVATTFFLCKNQNTIQLANKWFEASLILQLIDDSKSINPNSENFIENRHDQSIFSILSKLFNAKENCLTQIYLEANAILSKENKNWADCMRDYPIWAMRNKKMNLYDFLSDKLNIFFRKRISNG